VFPDEIEVVPPEAPAALMAKESTV